MAPAARRIIADDRERKSGIPRLLKGAGLDVEIRTLLVGDYIVAPETIVERKTVPDLVSSIFDGRLFDQCARLKEHYERPVLLVEGGTEELVCVIENPMVFYGALARVALDFAIPIIPAANAEHAAKLLAVMCSRSPGAAQGPMLKKIRRSSDAKEQQLILLCGLPGVGAKTAVRLLERFGSPAAAFAAPLSELSRVPGFGPARAKRARSALGAKNAGQKRGRQKTLG